jgi:hypothetical protein
MLTDEPDDITLVNATNRCQNALKSFEKLANDSRVAKPQLRMPVLTCELSDSSNFGITVDGKMMPFVTLEVSFVTSSVFFFFFFFLQFLHLVTNVVIIIIVYNT